jgi:predicted TIM-barrel fold metal-dependent hydrolase
VCYRKDAPEFALSVLGAGRLVFGSDFGCPGKNFVRPQMLKEFVGSLDVSMNDKDRILGRNLAEVLKIESTPRLDLKHA